MNAKEYYISTWYPSARGDCLCEWVNLSLTTYLYTMAPSHMVYVCAIELFTNIEQLGLNFHFNTSLSG